MAQINESQEQVTINVETLQPVTRTLMTIGALPTSYLISMTYEEQLLWLQNYLIQTVIPAINNNAEATEEVQDIVMALQDYINDYFNNLDVQEEINNKLEQMAQDGSLTTLIENYVNPYIQAQNQEISNFKTSVNNQIAQQNAQIQSVASGSPLVASNVAGMTDTSRTYVNTTDGNWYYYNGTEWVIGGIYTNIVDYDEFINDYQNVSSRFKYNHKDFFKNVTMYAGKTMNGAGATILNYVDHLTDSSVSNMTAPFRVRYDNGLLVFNSNDWVWDTKNTAGTIVWAFDKNGDYLRSYTGATFDYTNIQNDVYYIMVRQFTNINNTITLKDINIEWLSNTEIYEVGVGKQYTSFIDCLKALQSNFHNKIIKVYPGTYDIFEELGGVNFINSLDTSLGWRENSVFVPMNTKVVGIGNVVFNYLPSQSQVTSYANSSISVLNINGNVEIENITINGQYCRYLIHDETSNNSDYNNMYHKFRNVNLNYLNSTAISFPSGICFGCGFNSNEEFQFDNCKFICDRPSGGPIYMHNWSGDNNSGSVITFNNCVLKNVNNRTVSLQLGNTHSNTSLEQVNIVNVNSTFLSGFVGVINPDNHQNIKNSFKINMINTSNVNINIDDTMINSLTPQTYNPIG